MALLSLLCCRHRALPPGKTVPDHDGGELRGHGGAAPHARAGRPVPGLAGAAGPHHLPLPAHAALLVVSTLPATPSRLHRTPGPRPGLGPRGPQTSRQSQLVVFLMREFSSLFKKISPCKRFILEDVLTYAEVDGGAERGLGAPARLQRPTRHALAEHTLAGCSMKRAGSRVGRGDVFGGAQERFS